VDGLSLLAELCRAVVRGVGRPVRLVGGLMGLIGLFVGAARVRCHVGRLRCCLVVRGIYWRGTSE
jgi:hypothetical protein